MRGHEKAPTGPGSNNVLRLRIHYLPPGASGVYRGGFKCQTNTLAMPVLVYSVIEPLSGGSTLFWCNFGRERIPHMPFPCPRDRVGSDHLQLFVTSVLE